MLWAATVNDDTLIESDADSLPEYEYARIRAQRERLDVARFSNEVIALRRQGYSLPLAWQMASKAFDNPDGTPVDEEEPWDLFSTIESRTRYSNMGPSIRAMQEMLRERPSRIRLSTGHRKGFDPDPVPERKSETPLMPRKRGRPRSARNMNGELLPSCPRPLATRKGQPCGRVATRTGRDGVKICSFHYGFETGQYNAH
jgi:hypothetical protein